MIWDVGSESDEVGEKMYENEISKPQFAYIHQPSGMDSPSIFCPFCGTRAMNNGGEVEGCIHLTFIYLESKEKFIFGTDDFMRMVKKVEKKSDFEFDDEDEDEFFERIFEAGGYGSELLVLYITHGGKATDQIIIEDKYGFDISRGEK